MFWVGACIWYIFGEVSESDIRLDKVDYDWTIYPGASDCDDRYYDIEAVMAHERGHTYGLGHVTVEDHGRLTMSEAMRPCDGQHRTLGLGDVRSLRQKYGVE